MPEGARKANLGVSRTPGDRKPFTTAKRGAWIAWTVLSRAFSRKDRWRRLGRRLARLAVSRPTLGAVPAAVLVLVLAACAPVLSAAPATAASLADAGATGGADAGGTTAAAQASIDTAPVAPDPAAPGGSASQATPAPDAGAAPPSGDPPAAAVPPAPGTGLAGAVQEGIASWYGPNFAGRLTSNGEIFDPSKLTAAHRTLPFGTMVKVTNLVNGKSVVVRINDRGPFKPNRIIDLSEGAAKAIGMVRMGVARVRLQPLSLPDGVVRLGVDPKLHGYDVLSRFHKVGQLLVLSKRSGADAVVVRVVGTDVPSDSGVDVLVASDLYDLIGSQAHVQDR